MGATVAQPAFDVRDLGSDFGRRAIRFREQDGLCGEVVACFHEWLHRDRRLAVHHFKACRNDACGNDGGDCVACLAGVIE